MRGSGASTCTSTREATQAQPHDPDASAKLFINILLNVDHDTKKFMIIKLVSNIDTRRSIEEVLSTVAIVSQEECTPPYAVDQHAFWNHTRGGNKGLPCDSDPSVRTVGERMASFRAKKKILSLPLALAR